MGAAEHSRFHQFSPLTYATIWIALLILTLATWGFSFLDLGEGSVVIAVCIAIAKATLVLIFFMHFLAESGSARLTLLVALTFVAVLYVLVQADFAFRFPLSVIREEPEVPISWRSSQMTPPTSAKKATTTTGQSDLKLH